MTRKTIIIVSVLRDALDLVGIGQIPGLNILLNLPVIVLHYWYAGPMSLVTLVENITGIETLPCFTAMALAYPNKEAVKEKTENTETNQKDLSLTGKEEL